MVRYLNGWTISTAMAMAMAMAFENQISTSLDHFIITCIHTVIAMHMCLETLVIAYPFMCWGYSK